MQSIKVYCQASAGLIPDGLQHILDNALTPLAKAKSGDVVAFVSNVRHQKSTHTSAITQYLVKRGDIFSCESYDNLPSEQQSALAHTSMLINTRHLNHLAHHAECSMDRMSAGDGEYFTADLFLFPKEAVLISDEADDYLENYIEFSSEIDEETGDRLVQILTSPQASNHKELKRSARLMDLQIFLNNHLLFEINDDNGDMVPLVMEITHR